VPDSQEIITWISEIAAARKREKDWRTEAKRVLEIYNGEKKENVVFNILFSNTETLQPALYNTTPRPVVERRFKDADPIGKASSLVGQRTLEFLLDTNSEEYASFDSIMGDAVLDGLLPGRASTRIRYDAKTQKVKNADGTETPVLLWETVCYESVKWNRLIIGYAQKWEWVPWIAFEHDVTEDEAKDLFGAEMARKLTYTAGSEYDSEDGEKKERDEKTDEEERKTTRVYEVWDRAGGRIVRFIAPCYKDGYCKQEEDPLELTGFFPMPKPLRFHRKANNLMPTALYTLYENQAQELNRISTRINKIVEALKVRGVYDSTMKEIEGVLKQEDNALVPAENVAAMQESSFDKAIWLVPIEKLVVVLQQLILAREQCKQVIYEITGISDIIRGQAKASETLGAQQIKENWVTLRLKRLQRDVQTYARDILRISLEIAAKKFLPRTFMAMTGLQFATEEQLAAANGAIALARATGQQPPPEAVAILQSPSWPKILELLRADTLRAYRIDIETNSTVDLEATEDKQQVTEFMNAMGQFLSGIGPLVENGTMPFEAAKAMMLEIARRFRFGVRVEEQLNAMQPPQPKGDQAKEQELMKKEQELMRRAAELDVKQTKFDAMQETRAERGKLEAEKVVNQLQSIQDTGVQRAETLMTRHEIKVQGLIEKALLQIGNAKSTLSAAKVGQDKSAQAAQQQQATAEVGRMLQSVQTTLMQAFAQMQKEHAAEMQTILKVLAAPKQILRGPDGKISEVVPQV
jgi:hypothetical protein